ncbi:MAG: hypothetical protein HDS83_03230 [Bacteroidales bacterium]|nr:hypothetical protein [Bacteroidales bacterium]
MKRSREIIEIIADVVKETTKDCKLVVMDGRGGWRSIDCPEINYTFGNSQYVKDRLDILSKPVVDDIPKFPLIALFCPFNEQRNSPDYYTKAKVRILIATSTDKEWTNEQRLNTSFKNILRPIYQRFIEALKEDGRLDFGYEEVVAHEYSENYSYGRYGAYTADGQAVSEPIDAINISNLELKVKSPNCRLQ